MKNLFNVLLVISIVLTSCSVERRLHRPGLSIQWHSIRKGKDKTDHVQDQHSFRSESTTASSTVGSEEQNSGSLSEIQAINEENGVVDHPESTGSVGSLVNSEKSIWENEDTTVVETDERDVPVEEDVYHPERSGNKYGWIYILLLILFYAILATILYFGALYPFQAGVILLVPLSILFGLEDRAGFLFGIFGGMSYIGLFFLSGSVGFWGIFFLGFLALMLSLGLAALLDDVFDQGERKDDYPPPPPPQEANPGDDW